MLFEDTHRSTRDQHGWCRIPLRSYSWWRLDKKLVVHCRHSHMEVIWKQNFKLQFLAVSVEQKHLLVHCKNCNIEVSRRQHIELMFSAKTVSSNFLSWEGICMVILTVIDKRPTLCFIRTVVTVPLFKNACAEYHFSRAVHGNETSTPLVHCKLYHVVANRRQKVRAECFVSSWLPYGNAYSSWESVSIIFFKYYKLPSVDQYSL